MSSGNTESLVTGRGDRYYRKETVIKNLLGNSIKSGGSKTRFRRPGPQASQTEGGNSGEK